MGSGRDGKKGNSFIAFLSIFSIEFFYSKRAKLSLFSNVGGHNWEKEENDGVYFRSRGDVFLFN